MTLVATSVHSFCNLFAPHSSSELQVFLYYTVKKMPAYKNYVAVSFENGQHAVIPNHWLLEKGKKMFCRWPPSDVDERSANFERPHLNWKICAVKAIITQASKLSISKRYFSSRLCN